jgi:Mor family transcriptional regulator
MNAPDIDPDLLAIFPPVLIQVVRALGIVRAREVLHVHGGLNVNIAKHHSKSLGITDKELAELRRCLDGHMDVNGRVYMPKVDKLLSYARDEQIRREAGKKSIPQQARDFKLSVRQVMNIRAGGRDEVSTEAKNRKSLNLNEAELAALATLARVQLERTQDNLVLLRILNKLDRARVASKATGAKVAQFDLF